MCKYAYMDKPVNLTSCSSFPNIPVCSIEWVFGQGYTILYGSSFVISRSAAKKEHKV